MNKDNIIEIKDLIVEYLQEEGKAPVQALKGINLNIKKGSFTAILGQNGSGKSTLAKCLNGLIVPTSGTVTVNGMDTASDETIWELRQTAGMVFQNPDNQLVSSTVEDDVAFGPENVGIAPDEIRKRVDKALKAVDMWDYRRKAPHLLSGGQKQRVAIAGVVAMRPECIIFDEPTAMLDPKGRNEIMNIIEELHGDGITVILITHFMEEATAADRIVVLEDGNIKIDGAPKEVFMKMDEIKEAGLELPLGAELAHGLRSEGINVPEDVITEEEMVRYICQFR